MFLRDRVTRLQNTPYLNNQFASPDLFLIYKKFYVNLKLKSQKCLKKFSQYHYNKEKNEIWVSRCICMKIPILWNMGKCNLENGCHCIGTNCSLRLQGRGRWNDNFVIHVPNCKASNPRRV